VQAAIQAAHADASDAAETDWAQILDLYDLLLALLPTPVVALNRAMALAEVAGPPAALEVVEALDLPTYQPFHAVRADLLTRAGRLTEAVAAYDRAIALTGNDVERAHLQRRREQARPAASRP
jgi:RNA polymerase sigma-70 factor (ECF subfamily)